MKSKGIDIDVTLGWWHRFRARNPQIILRKGESLSQAWLDATNRDVVDAYYALLYNILEERQLLNKPSQIFNCDETGVPLVARTGHVIVEKGLQHPYVATSGDKKNLTVLACVSATAYVLPPIIIFDRKKN